MSPSAAAEQDMSSKGLPPLSLRRSSEITKHAAIRPTSRVAYAEASTIIASLRVFQTILRSEETSREYEVLSATDLKAMEQLRGYGAPGSRGNRQTRCENQYLACKCQSAGRGSATRTSGAARCEPQQKAGSAGRHGGCIQEALRIGCSADKVGLQVLRLRPLEAHASCLCVVRSQQYSGATLYEKSVDRRGRICVSRTKAENRQRHCPQWTREIRLQGFSPVRAQNGAGRQRSFVRFRSIAVRLGLR